MASNIVEAVQKRMGYEPLQKIDPNTQEPPATEVFTSPASAQAQATIPAVLAAIYENAKDKDSVQEVFSRRSSTDLYILFGDNTPKAIQAVANYGKISSSTAKQAMEKAYATSCEVVIDEVKDGTPENIMAYMKEQRDNILHYLPASLQIGKLLDHNTLDDRTNKMEGPVSGLMHSFEKVFSDTKQ